MTKKQEESTCPDCSQKNIVRGILISTITTILIFGLFELYTRQKFPFSQLRWPSQFKPNIGWIFIPGEELRHTNYLDFAISQKINSWGFPDREPTHTFASNEFRILLLGDSFVEGAQVQNQDKLHVVLEGLIQEAFPRLSIKTQALGYSGSGTSNVIPFYTEIGRQFKPHLVLLLFVNNDFSNNSPLLESIRNGWDPYHPPRLFYEREGDSFRKIPIDPTWSSHLLPVHLPPSAHPGRERIGRGFDNLFSWSSFYFWIKSRYSATSTLKSTFELHHLRLEYLRLTPEYRRKFEGWKYPNDLDMDNMFFADRSEMPLVFSDALDISKHAIDILSRAVKEDNASFMVVATDRCSHGVPSENYERTIVDRGYFLQLQKITSELNLPLLEVDEYFKKQKVSNTHFANDLHWNSNGHYWAAKGTSQFINDYVLEHEAKIISSTNTQIIYQQPN